MGAMKRGYATEVRPGNAYKIAAMLIEDFLEKSWAHDLSQEDEDGLRTIMGEMERRGNQAIPNPLSRNQAKKRRRAERAKKQSEARLKAVRPAFSSNNGTVPPWIG